MEEHPPYWKIMVPISRLDLVIPWNLSSSPDYGNQREQMLWTLWLHTPQRFLSLQAPLSLHPTLKEFPNLQLATLPPAPSSGQSGAGTLERAECRWKCCVKAHDVGSSNQTMRGVYKLSQGFFFFKLMFCRFKTLCSSSPEWILINYASLQAG